MDALPDTKINQPKDKPINVSSKAPCSCGIQHNLINKYTVVEGIIWFDCSCGSTRVHVEEA